MLRPTAIARHERAGDQQLTNNIILNPNIWWFYKLKRGLWRGVKISNTFSTFSYSFNR